MIAIAAAEMKTAIANGSVILSLANGFDVPAMTENTRAARATVSRAMNRSNFFRRLELRFLVLPSSAHRVQERKSRAAIPLGSPVVLSR